jgi:hypothetical protein
MGATQSTRIFHHLGDRGHFITSRDLFERRTIAVADEEVYGGYYTAYAAECARHGADQAAMEPNEDLQQALEVLDENLHTRAAAVNQVVAKYLHDVLHFAQCVVDDLGDDEAGDGGDALAPPREQRRRSSYGADHVDAGMHGEATRCVGSSFVSNGFFFYLWHSSLGEKFGRLEATCCDWRIVNQ